MNPHQTLIELEQNLEKLTTVYKTNAAKLSRQSSLAFNDYTVNPLLRAMNELLKEYRARYDQHREQINELEKQNQYKDFVNNNQALDITRLEKLITDLRKSTDELMDGFNKERVELQEQNSNLRNKLIDLEHKITIKENTTCRLMLEKQELENLLATAQPITREMLKRVQQEHSHKYDNAPPEPCTFEELVGEPMNPEITCTHNHIIYRKADVQDIGKMVYFTNVNIENAIQNPKHKLINVDHDQRFPYLADTNIGYTKAYIELNPKFNHAEFMQQVIEEMESPETIAQFAPTMNPEPKKSDIEVLNTINEILKQPEQTQNLEIHSVYAYNNETFRLANINDLNKNVLFSDKGIAESYCRPEGILTRIDTNNSHPYTVTGSGKNYAFKYAFVRLSQPSQPVTQFSTGAVRSTDANSTRYDLISPVGLRRIAETYAEGAKKYGDNNWQKGMPASDTMNHAIRHINLWLSGDKTEDHLAHAAWNLIAIMHFEELKPECIDVPTRRTT